VFHEIYTKYHFIFSSVPGPADEVKLAGKKVSRCRVFVRLVVPNITALSYNDEVHILLTADDEAISHVHLLPALYMKGLVKIATEFGVAVPEVVQDAACKAEGQLFDII